jgi:hypothetical protein
VLAVAVSVFGEQAMMVLTTRHAKKNFFIVIIF